jgi:hypothetical protein
VLAVVNTNTPPYDDLKNPFSGTGHVPFLIKQDEKEKSIMHLSYRVEKAIDQAIGRRILSSCWLVAGLGVSIFQMLLLAQAWSLHQQAFVPACLVSAWVLGGIVGIRLRADARFLGMSVVLCALFWLDGTHFISWQTTIGLFSSWMVHVSSLVVCALLLGAISTAWLSQRRLWSPAGEQVTLSRTLIGTTAGLFVVWVFPSWAWLLGLLGVLPLLVFDLRFANRAPQPEETGVVEAWVSRYWQPESRQLRFLSSALPRNRWWSYLVERAQESKGFLLLTLLASSAAVILGGVWGAVPTAFAGGMFETHELDKLGWLLVGQIVALVIGVCWFRAERGVIPSCDLTRHSEMREKHHGTQSYFILSQLSECLTEHLNQVLQRGEYSIVQVFLAHFLPQMLDGIDLWTICWLKNQAHILRHLQIFGPVPARLIDLHDNKVVGKITGHLSQKEIHHRRIGVWQDERGHQALLWSHGCIDIAELANDLPRSFRSHSRPGPSAFGPITPSKASLILGHF